MILKNMRLSAGISQKELAQKLSLADTTISSYEGENSQADFDTIIKIADICGYDVLLKDGNNNLMTIEEMTKEKDY